MLPNSIFDALQFAVGPVILISAYGLLLLSMTNRMGRAIDRARLLSRDSEGNKDFQIAIISKRARWIRSAILFTSLAIFAAALLVLLLFLSIFLPMDIKMLVSTLFILSLICLIIALVYFIVDIFGSLKAMEADLASRHNASGK